MDRKEKKDEKGKELQEEGRRPDCVTTVCSGGTVLVVKGYLKQGGRETGKRSWRTRRRCLRSTGNAAGRFLRISGRQRRMSVCLQRGTSSTFLYGW